MKPKCSLSMLGSNPKNICVAWKFAKYMKNFPAAVVAFALTLFASARVYGAALDA